MGGWTVEGLPIWRERAEGLPIGLRVDRIFAAVDAVVNPATGQIVCRTTLFSTLFAGCQPLNLFGRGNASGGAVDWVVGNEPGEQITTPLAFADTGFSLGITDSYTSQEAKVNITEMTQNVAELSASGEVWEGWGAGPITAAFGLAYRDEDIFQIVRDRPTESSDHVAGHPVLCNGDPAAIAAGLRGVNPPRLRQHGRHSIFEGVEHPVVRSRSRRGGRSFRSSPTRAFSTMRRSTLAARYADYTGSGGIWAYKAGLDVLLGGGSGARHLFTRDVRAANPSSATTGPAASRSSPIRATRRAA